MGSPLALGILFLHVLGWGSGGGTAAMSDAETDELVRVATQGASDDVERAAKLIEAAETFRDKPGVQEMLYSKAYDFGLNQAKGLDLALKALDALAGLQRTAPAELDAKRLNLYRLRHKQGPAAGRSATAAVLLDLLMSQGEAKAKAGQAADALALHREALGVAGLLNRRDVARQINEQIKDATARLALEGRAKALEEKIAAAPEDDRARRELVLLYIVELDDPARAKAALDTSVDSVLQTYVPMAATDIEAVAPQGCLELAKWYVELSGKAGRTGQINTLQRARAYYTRAVDSGALAGTDKVKVELTLQQIETRLQAAGGAAKAGVNLLALVNLRKDAVSGTWKADGRSLVSDSGILTRVMLPYEVGDEYDYRVDFTRNSGNSTVTLILSKGGREFVLETGWPGGQTGFAYVNGKHIDTNPTGTRFHLTNGRRYSFVIQVRNTGLKAFVDGRQIIAWRTDYRNVTPHTGWSLPDRKCLGFGSYLSSTSFHVAEIVDVSGRGKRLR